MIRFIISAAKYLTVSLIVFTAVISTACAATGEQSESIRFLTLSDIHFDPFIACHQIAPCPLIKKLRQASAGQWPEILKSMGDDKPQLGQDTGYSLLRAALAAAKKNADAQGVKFVIVLGDFLGHDYRSSYINYAHDSSVAGYRSFVNKTLLFLMNELQHTFPNMSIYPVVGNNDGYNADYIVKPNGAFFREAAVIWSVFIKDSSDRKVFSKIFPVGGYYAVTIPQMPQLRLIVMNSVLFSTKNGHGKDIEKASVDQLNWLHDQLQLADQAHQKVLIAMHIPSGIDIYASLHYRLFRMIELWERPYADRFESELKMFAPEIAGIFAGHLHVDWLQTLAISNANTIPVTGTPSISPIFNNNPGYKIYSYSSESGEVNDFEVYYFHIGEKQAEVHKHYHLQRDREVL